MEHLDSLLDPGRFDEALRVLRRQKSAAIPTLIAAVESPALKEGSHQRKQVIKLLGRLKSVDGLHAAVAFYGGEYVYDHQYGHTLPIALMGKAGEAGIARLLHYLEHPPIPDGYTEKQAQSRRWSLGYAVMEALSKAPALPKEALPILLRVRDGLIPNARINAPRAVYLAGPDPDTALMWLQWSVKHGYEPIVCNGIRFQGPCGHPDAVPILHRMLGNHRRNVRQSAIRVLLEIRDAEGIVMALDDAEPRNRVEAIKAAGNLGCSAALPKLTVMAEKDRSKKARAAALEVIASLSSQ